MITTISKLRNLVFLLAFAGLVSCEPDPGPAGPAGATGPAGPAGAAGAIGPQGVMGNANVTLYTYGTKTFSFWSNYILPDISQTKMDSCILLAYASISIGDGEYWFPVPGISPVGTYQSFYSTWKAGANYNVYVQLYTLSGGSYYPEVTWPKFKIYVVSPSVIYSAKGNSTIDLSSPDALDEYLITHKE